MRLWHAGLVVAALCLPLHAHPGRLQLRARSRRAYHLRYRSHDGLGWRVFLAWCKWHKLVGGSARGSGDGLHDAFTGSDPLALSPSDQRAGRAGNRGLKRRRG